MSATPRPLGARRNLRQVACASACLLLGAGVGRAQIGDPFSPGIRWSHEATAATPWIPGSVAFAGDDGLAWASAEYGTPHLFCVETAGSGTPRFEEHGVAAAEIVLSVAAGRRADALFAVAQYSAPDVYHRRIEVTRHDALAAAAGGMFAPVWTYDPGLSINGPSLLASDAAGDRAVLAALDPAQGTVTVDVLSGEDGGRLARSVLPAAGLSVLAVSAEGERVALVCGTELWVLDAWGAVLDQRALAGSTRALALSKDGARIVYGDGSAVRVLAEQPGGGYAVTGSLSGLPGEIVARAAVAADGSTFAAGWWNAQTAVDLRFVLADAQSLATFVEIARSGPAGGRQAFPEALAVSADGRRAAFGTWGDGLNPAELLLVDRDAPAPVLSAVLPGSVRGLALDRTGRRVLVAYKHGHANVSGSTGGLALYDTGEADLALLAPVRAGADLRLAARRPGAEAALFVLGTRADRPLPLAGGFGLLHVDRGARLVLLPAAVDARGRADLSVPLPAEPWLVGLEFAAQAVFWTAGELALTETALDLVGL